MKNILLVEDQLIIAKQNEIVLSKNGYQVFSAQSGEEAIEFVNQRDDIDLVLMDINLGNGMDGTAAAKYILGEHDLPLIFLSSHTEREVVARTEDITSYGYIVKDAGETVMLASIRMAFKLYKAHRQLKQTRGQLESKIFLLKAINHINYVLAHTSDTQNMMDEICRILVEEGKFSMSWLGIVNANTQQVEPVAVYGDEFNYVKSITVYADERPEGQGPIGIAIRTAKSVVVQDAMNDPRLTVWLEQRRKTNWNSSIAIPFRLAGDANAILVVYTHDVNYFGDAEISMLEAVASNFTIITERNAEEKLRLEREQQLKEVYKLSGIGVWTWTAETRQVSWTDEVYTIMGMDKSQPPPSREALQQMYAEESRERLNSAIDQSMKSKLPYSLPLTIIRPDGSKRQVNATGRIVFNAQGHVKEFQGTLQDVTHIYEAEAMLKEQLEQKSVLLTEINHRTKNNLSIIEGLLNLQLNTISHPEAANALKDAIGRVKSMQALYEQLLQSEDFQHDGAREYVENLIQKIRAFFIDAGHIQVSYNIERFSLDAKRLLSLGIVINELMTNAFKHAFRGLKEGLLTIDLENKQGEITLSIRDNGTGLPDNAKLDTSKGLGMMLVKLMSQELKGQVTYSNNGGAHFVLSFKTQT